MTPGNWNRHWVTFLQGPKTVAINRKQKLLSDLKWCKFSQNQNILKTVVVTAFLVHNFMNVNMIIPEGLFAKA